MKKHILLAAVATLAFGPAAFAQGNMGSDSGSSGMKSGAAEHSRMSSDKAQIGAADQAFVTKASISNMFEVEASEVALKKAEGDEVKTFAKHMIKDHGKAGKELESLAEDLGAKVPSELDAKHAQMLDKLKGLEGAEFEGAYIKAQRDAHHDAVALFASYSKSNGNPELTAWAGKTLPTLEEHAMHVKELNVMADGGGESNMGRASSMAPPNKQATGDEGRDDNRMPGSSPK